MVNDIVQPVLKSGIVRNRINMGGEEQYIGISAVKKHLSDISIADLLISDMKSTRERVLGRIISAYHSAPFYKEIFPFVEELFSKDYIRVIEIDMATIDLLRKLFAITTPMIYHSDLNLTNLSNNKSDNIIKKCLSINADVYLSGNGAKKYIEPWIFEKNNIRLVFQDFTYPVYPQQNSSEFIPNLSSLDILFNCGKDEAKRIFWENVKSTNEIK